MKGAYFERVKQIRNASLSVGQTFYLITLNQFIGNNTDAWPSQTTLANAMNASSRAVRKWQAELEKMKVLRVEVGKGRSSTNRYRLNLEALPKKEEPRSAIGRNPACERGTSFRHNEEPSSGQSRNHVPTERTVKEHKKEQGVSFPAELNTEPFRIAWSEWVTYLREHGKKLTPSTVSKQFSQLSKWGSYKAIQAIDISISNGWTGLFDPDKSKDRSPGGSSEAELAWQTVAKAAHDFRYEESQFKKAIGEQAEAVLKSQGITAAKIDYANEHGSRELRTKFIKAFPRQRSTK